MSNLMTAFANVEGWNRFGRNGDPSNLTEAMNLQLKLIKEEASELEDAIFEEDFFSIVHELCDLVVVWSYYLYMKGLQDTGVPDRDRHITNAAMGEQRGYLRGELIGTDIHTNYITFDGGPVPVDYSGVLGIILRRVIDEQLGGVNFEHKFFDNFGRVMESNWSKFPLVSDIEDIEEELVWIKKFYQDTKGQNIDVIYKVRTDQDGNQRYTFANAETGKYVKPSTFHKAVMFL